MKVVIVVMLVAVLCALGGAGFVMLKKRDPTEPPHKHMARVLALRVALSVALFLFILLSWWMGWVKPSGIPMGG